MPNVRAVAGRRREMRLPEVVVQIVQRVVQWEIWVILAASEAAGIKRATVSRARGRDDDAGKRAASKRTHSWTWNCGELAPKAGPQYSLPFRQGPLIGPPGVAEQPGCAAAAVTSSAATERRMVVLRRSQNLSTAPCA